MENRTNLAGLAYRGNGFFAYQDESNPRMSDLDVARLVGKSVGKRVTHISSSPCLGHRMHVLQYSHLYKKDMEREASKLAHKFNDR
jgi:hypothetical protein